MIETGAIARVVALVKTISPKDQVVQVMIINVGFGTLLAALGATPVSILPPIMLAMGYSSFVAIALPALGYDALCTYALLGVPIVVFSSFVGQPVSEVGLYFARFYAGYHYLHRPGYVVDHWKMETGMARLAASVTLGFEALALSLLE